MSEARGGMAAVATSRRVVAPLLAVVLAGLVGGVLIWAVRGHQTSQPAVPVAIVNEDQPVTTGSGSDQKTVAAGRQLAANLSEPPPAAQTPLAWELMDANDAASRLQNGTVYGVLTIPAGFSAAITSSSGSNPQRAALTLDTNDTASLAVGALATLTVDQAASALGQQVTSNYVNGLLQNITSIHGSLSSSADSATTLAGSSSQLAASTHQLDGSTQQLAGSAQQLADSSGQLAGSSEQLAGSTHELATSAGQVASGAAAVDEGATSLATGADSLASGAGSLATGADQAAAGTAQVAAGTAGIVTAAETLGQGAQAVAGGATDLSSATSRVSTGASAVANQASDLQQGLQRVDTGAGQVVDGAAALAAAARDLADRCPVGADPGYCAEVVRLAATAGAHAEATRVLQAAVGVEVRRSGVVAQGAGGVATASSGLAGGAEKVSAGATQVSDGAGSLASAAGQLASGATSAAAGSAQVATGAAQTSDGASTLASSSHQLASGTSGLASGSTQLAGGATQLAGGADQLASGATQLADGATQLAGGATQLATGADQLAGGADQLSGGNQQLATGLTNGAAQVPSYTDDQRSQIVTVVTTPVNVDSAAGRSATVAASLVPVILALTLWLGTLMVFLVRSSVPTGPGWPQASARRRVAVGLLPAALAGIVLAGVVLLVVLISGTSVRAPAGLVGLAALGAVAFAALNQAFVALFGTAGRLVSLAFVAVQAAALGGLVPIETAPGPLQLLNGLLPLPQLVTGAGQLVLGGGGKVAGAVLTLVAWLVVGIVVAVLATARRRPVLAEPRRPAAALESRDLMLAIEGG